ncbi:hypothetical protein BDU57DRAFT_103375 [Ampelomyces quisqualis]|uniref:Reverse transcriptase domain-containing protein n=1 Tax=Ampelomyces quisqualis TaxID=50730 RepID=A0A6A5Q9L0_AMPQU|nr:hypothetical protein BDU57DRAFT_103375 [Ampelomyces quisqualis]
MDAMPQLLISPLLREAADFKIDELNRAKDDFISRYHANVGHTTKSSTVMRVKSLLGDVIKLNPELEDDDDLGIISRYVERADDHSVSQSKFLKFEQQIRKKLDKHLSRLGVSTLHVELMKEVMDAGRTTASLSANPSGTDLDDDFEVVGGGELDEVLEKFEKQTFTSEDVDTEAIDAHLSGLFTRPIDKVLLDNVRDDLGTFGEEVLADGMEIDDEYLTWCIADLLRSDIVGEDKKATLAGYLRSPIALRELTSILNAKSIRNWNYKNADQGLPVTASQDYDGQYHIVFEESIIDLLFLYCLGIGWAMKLKSCLKTLARGAGSFDVTFLTPEQTNKREYFLGRNPAKPQTQTPLPSTVCSACHPPYPPAPMPPPPPPGMCPSPPPPLGMCPPPPPDPNMYLHHLPPRKIKMKNKVKYSWLMPPPPPSYGNLNSTRREKYIREFFMSRLPAENGSIPKVTPQEEVQASLIKTLVLEKHLRKAFDGEVYSGSAQFKSLAASLPHQTVLTVLKFIGMPEAFLGFFERYLSAKLNIGPAVRGAPDRVLPRARGVPEGHSLEMFFTETVMFFLELDVRQKAQSYLYRLGDSCHFVGDVEQYLAYEEQVAKFADVMGLDVEFADTQSIGLVTHHSGTTAISGPGVVSYARRVKKQLSICTTVFDWVRVWNITIGTYAAHLFGPLVNIMGKAHLDNVRNTYKIMFDIILDNRDLTTHLTHLLLTHLHLSPSFPIEPFAYLPPAYGGLGVKNPFITLNLADSIATDPNTAFQDYLDSEENYFTRAASNYALLDAQGRARKIQAIFDNDTTRMDAALGPTRDLSAFMRKEELTTHRENAPYPALPMPPFPAPWTPTPTPSLTTVYEDLLRAPFDVVLSSEKVGDDVRRLAGKGGMRSWRNLSGEEKWVLQLYGDECFEAYGGLEIWVGEMVPREVLRIVRGGVLEEGNEDDGSSVSDLTEP